ncbi:phosphatidylethanolamine N-methyltransferase [Rhizoctonia solani AG-3 Rhs1AP]|uniref:Phosphatidylethanolamine N-methyltransferase n=1 Tax=Rhizoctonia solani AG-3 Rhs1AP TaxID=1086054 RepID=X8IXP1_9AGAM|nr:phosphatidylethanolamine N-methyltransferase [Rhizoctonia solani AG-3 Rhs1AP]
MSAPSGLKRRKNTLKGPEGVSKAALDPETAWGRTPAGQIFRIPTTQDVLTSLFHPLHPKSHLDLVNLALLGGQILLFAVLPRAYSRALFLVYFAFWRLAYDVGLGWVLTKQSKRRWIVKQVHSKGWLDQDRRPKVYEWIRNELRNKMGDDYSFDQLPIEYNTWLLFRQAVDIILINDFLSYCMFAFTVFRIPDDLSVSAHVLRWLAGFALILFNLWVKTEAHHIVKDYGWYWGDVFFERGRLVPSSSLGAGDTVFDTSLVFDGVFEMAPHPMYSVGYAGYYGLSLIVGSYSLLFVSLWAHAMQFGFLVWFENPHIERAYGQKQLIGARTPLVPSTPLVRETELPRAADVGVDPADLSTPAHTDAETETETETENLSPMISPVRASPVPSLHIRTSSDNLVKIDSDLEAKLAEPKRPGHSRHKSLSRHDLLARYFRKDVVGFKNIDLLRASDLKLVLLTLYIILPSILPSTTTTYFVHALMWRIFHSFVLGGILKAQSGSKWLVRHFVEKYHYEHGREDGALEEAFTSWKQIYTMSLYGTYTSFAILAWKTYSPPAEWAVGDQLLRHTLGVLLLGLHLWAALQTFEVLGVFGWFFGDFFISDYPAQLSYTGIYRFMNNPERTMSGASLFGLALISGSRAVFALAVISMGAHWWFLNFVERPHMKKLYGNAIRKDAGLTKTLKNVAKKNANVARVAHEVSGTFEKVYGEAAEAVESFLSRSGPMISEVVQDTRILLQQSKEKLVITLVPDNPSSFDVSKYRMSVVPTNTTGDLRFHVGEPIRVAWRAPPEHSKKDWIGIYRMGANSSNLVTKANSQGMWVPVHDDQWDGDAPISHDKRSLPDSGEAVFQKDQLPWQVGKYELRYHHDGKYNVMSIAGPIEIYVNKPDTNDFDSVRHTLLRIVTLCLDSDPSLVPLSAGIDPVPSNQDPGSKKAQPTGLRSDPDDFRFWSERQAKRITTAVHAAFGVEYSPEVIVADANVTALSNRVINSLKLLGQDT